MTNTERAKSMGNGMLLGGAMSLILFIGLSLTVGSDPVEAGSTKTLQGERFKTPSGSIIEVVNVPGFGKCLLTSAMTVCKDK